MGDTATMARVALKPVVLSDGTRIAEGCRILVETKFFDGTTYHEPSKFDGFRFADLRNQTGHIHQWQLVSTSREQLGFGLGNHACPGKRLVSIFGLCLEWRLLYIRLTHSDKREILGCDSNEAYTLPSAVKL
jgi:cytochrome P450